MNEQTGLDDSIAEARPDIDSQATEVWEELEALVAALEHEEARKETDSPAKRDHVKGRNRVLYAALSGAVVLGLGVPAGAAAIGTWAARTGEVGGVGTEVIKDSEWMGLDADDAPEAIRDLYPQDLILPDGVSEDEAAGVVGEVWAKLGVVPAGGIGHATAQAVSIVGTYETFARCAWYRVWMDADDNGNESRRDEASAVLDVAATWPATASTDGGGVVEHLKSVAKSASEGDRVALLTGYKMSACADLTGAILQ